MHFGPVKKAVKGFLVPFAKSPPEWFQPFPFGFQDMAKRHNCPAHFPLLDSWGNYEGMPLKFFRESRLLII
jgi:hypothetical protein